MPSGLRWGRDERRTVRRSGRSLRRVHEVQEVEDVHDAVVVGIRGAPEGDGVEQLLPYVYDELRRTANVAMGDRARPTRLGPPRSFMRRTSG